MNSRLSTTIKNALALLALPIVFTANADPPADTIFVNGTVYTVDARDTIAQALAVRDGRIVYVGTNEGARRLAAGASRLIDLKGRMLMPGLIDGHLHPLSGGAQLASCDLDYAPLTLDEFKERIQACLDRSRDKEPDGWLQVSGWYRQFMRPAGTDADAAALDALRTQRPIVVTSTDGHTVVANSRALVLAKIDAMSPEPADGRIWRKTDGTPTGAFEDGGQKALQAAIPAASAAENERAARAALDALRRQGVTSFLDAAATSASLDAFTSIAKAGDLTARAHFAPVIELSDAAQPAQVVRDLQSTIGKYDMGPIAPRPGISVRNAKIFMDGVIQAPAQTAALMYPYRVDVGAPGHPHWIPGKWGGEVYFPADVLNPLLAALAQAHIEPHIHAIGDRAVHQALDAIEVMRQSVPDTDLRAAIAHCELVDPDDYGRFAELDAVAVMSFQWAKPGPDSIDAAKEQLGPMRFARMEPEGSLYDARARLAFGSDWPVDRLDEWFALKVGITRTGNPALGKKYAGRLNSERRLPRAAALRAITINAAYELHQDTDTGSIEPGKLADLIVIDRDVLQVPAEEIARTKVLMTMVGGAVVYEDGAFGP